MEMNLNRKQAILRNIAIVSAIFIATLSIMLVTNYFQVRNATPLQTEVAETLKVINDQKSFGDGTPALQEQIRQLDLLARKAYFVQMDHLQTGVYILLGMLTVFIVCVRLYYVHEKHIPEKEIDPIDEWAIKTNARRYVVGIVAGMSGAALLFTLLSSPFMKPAQSEQEVNQTEAAAVTLEVENDTPQEAASEAPAAEPEVVEEAVTEAVVATNATETATPAPTAAPQAAASAVTHHAFRGNNSDGISSAKGIPVKWDLADGTNIAWKQEIPREGYNSPVISGNKVFFSGADEQARELFCYDLTTGEKQWSLIADNIPGSPSQMPQTTKDTGLAASSVTTNGKQVCAIFATGDIICADVDGKRLWAKNLGVPDNHYGYASSLLVFGNSVIVQYDNLNSPKVVAFDLATGAQRWSRERKEKVTWSSPVIAYVNNSPQLVLMGNPAITAYNPNNGEELWRTECLSGEVGSSACSANGVIFGASEYATLVAIDGTNGNILWEGMDYLPEASSPVATKENLYLATSYGVAAAYDAKTGELRKEHELNTEFYSSPVIVEDKVYLFSNSGKMHIFAANNDFQLLNAFETGEKTFATPAFTDGKIVVRTEKSIYCVAANQAN